MEAGDDTALTVTDCERCHRLVDSRSQIVNGVGPADADLVFVGEAPGAREDELGEPFVGRSGGILDDALRDAGSAREAVRITNCIRCRPPDNRDPQAAELDNCRDYLSREIDLIDPLLLVTLGKVPAQHLLDRPVAVTAEAGETARIDVGGAARLVMICLHPAAVLYDRSQEQTFRQTITAAVEYADATGGQRRLGDF